MDVGVEDPLWEKRRVIKYRWMKRDSKSIPPERWFEAICGETEFQRQQDFDKKTGRKIEM